MDKDLDADRFSMLIAALASAFERDADESLAEAYWLGLSDLSIEEVEHGIQRATREWSYGRMPKPIELRRFAGHISPSLRAVHAWEALGKAIRSYGHRSSVDFDDPLINAAVRNMGGWSRVCALEGDEFSVWARREFERIYQALCESGASEDACRYLVGRDEHENSERGMLDWVPPVKRIETGLPPHSGDAVRRLGDGGEVIAQTGRKATGGNSNGRSEDHDRAAS